MHSLGQSTIHVNGSQALAETYCTAIHRIERDGMTSCDVAFMRYLDRLEQRADEWRILERRVLMEHTQTTTGEDDGGIRISDFDRGRRDRSDLSYEMFAQLQAGDF
jgi:hypothetical protein